MSNSSTKDKDTDATNTSPENEAQHKTADTDISQTDSAAELRRKIFAFKKDTAEVPLTAGEMLEQEMKIRESLKPFFAMESQFSAMAKNMSIPLSRLEIDTVGLLRFAEVVQEQAELLSKACEIPTGLAESLKNIQGTINSLKSFDMPTIDTSAIDAFQNAQVPATPLPSKMPDLIKSVPQETGKVNIDLSSSICVGVSALMVPDNLKGKLKCEFCGQDMTICWFITNQITIINPEQNTIGMGEPKYICLCPKCAETPVKKLYDLADSFTLDRKKD